MCVLLASLTILPFISDFDQQIINLLKAYVPGINLINYCPLSFWRRRLTFLLMMSETFYVELLNYCVANRLYNLRIF